MNINNLTIGQAKEIQSFFSSEEKKSTSIFNSIVGEYVLVRSRNEGLNAGYIELADETGIVLIEARRIWYHKPKDKSTSWYEGISISGLSNDSKISCLVNKKIIVEDYSITICSEAAKKSIQEHKTHAQN